MFFAAMLHSQFVPHIVVTMPQNWLGLGHAVLQKKYGETPVLCAIMIHHSPTMTSAQKLHGQDRASFGAQWPQCGAQTVSAALPQNTHG